MYHRWVLFGGFISTFLVLWVVYIPVTSECADLVHEGKDYKAFPVCMAMARKGDPFAQNIIGVSYATGVGITKNLSESLIWFQKSAAQGFSKAQNNLGLAYLEGLGVEKNIRKANQWWRQAALQGEATAQFNLAISYSNGYGVNRDVEKATEYYLASSLSYLIDGNFRGFLKSLKYFHAKPCSLLSNQGEQA